MNRWPLTLLIALTLALLTGCAALHEKQGEWIFQPTDRNWGGYGAAEGMQDTWIEFDSARTGQRTRLHGLWLPAEPRPGVRTQDAPVMLYLHGSRWNVASSAFRARRMQELGFSVLALDYRGFGKSDAVPPFSVFIFLVLLLILFDFPEFYRTNFLELMPLRFIYYEI